MWLIALLLLMSPQVSDSGPCGRASTSASAPIQPPFLIVQVVDPSWLPLPGAAVTVTVKPVTGKKESKVAYTMDDGDAKFWIPGDPRRCGLYDRSQLWRIQNQTPKKACI